MFSLLHSMALALTLSLFYVILLSIYRLVLHPLARFPGPKLAALTTWFETYHDVYPLIGRFTPRISAMHAQYGPIVRIGPNAVNIHDSEFWDTIYASASHRRDRRQCFSWSSGGPLSTFATVSHDLHRQRRRVLNPYFSKAAIRVLEGVVRGKVEKLCGRLRGKIGVESEEGVVRMDAAYAALTTDVITEYSYGKDWGFLDKTDFDLAWKNGLRAVWVNFLVFQNLRWWSLLASKLPPKWIVGMDPSLAGYVRLMGDVNKQVAEVMKGDEKEKEAGRKTIFHEVRDSNLPAAEKTQQRLVEEGMLVVAAGTETTARGLYLLTYYLLSNPDKLQKLREELKTAIKTDSPPLAELEKLPYLTAVVWEGLRLHGSVAQPNSRIAPDEPMQYGKWTIPPGTGVSEIPYLLLSDEELFPEPKEFIPERWLGEDAKAKLSKLSKIVFGSGPRLCLGINLAVAELYFTVTFVFSNFDLELVDSTAKDIATAHYSIGPVLSAESQGVRVRVKRMLEK